MKETQKLLAITGMACWLPGAENLEQYWQLLIENRVAIRKVPESILNRSLYYDAKKGERGKSYVDQGGLVSYPAFNQSVCRYPVHVMNYIEVGHLLMTETAAKACRHAGLNPFDLPLKNTGVYVGNNQAGHQAGNLSYSTIVAEAANYLKQLSIYRDVTGERAERIINEVVAEIRGKLPHYGHNGFPTVGYHVTANAVSNALGLSGPSIVLDAACSSSLKALSLAAHDIQLGQIDMAIVGGSSFFTTDSLLLFSAAQSGSANGCFPFSEKADGLISAEGCVAIVVKSLERALADGDPIQAIIPGIGVSSDGRGKSLWAPRKEGQVKAINRAYASESDMTWLDYVEAHATSTALGDQTELEAMQKAFYSLTQQAKIPVGGVKANIGHALEVAGLAGLAKAVLVLQNETVPKQVNSTPLNSKVDWDAMPFYVPQENTHLPVRQDGRARRAAVNSFGIGGLNVHVLLQEYRPGDFPMPQQADQNNTSQSQINALEPIAVIGMGAVFPGSRTAAAFEQLLFSGEDATCESPDRWDLETGFCQGNDASHWQTRARRGGFIDDFQYDWTRHRIAPKQIANADPLQFMILDSVDAAIVDAGYDAKQLPTETTGVIVGSTFDTDFATQLCMGFRIPHFQRELRKVLERHGIVDRERVEQILKQFSDMLLKKMPAILDETGSFTPSTLSSRITKTYDFMGGAGTIDTGDSVGLAALMQAANELRSGACDLMVCSVGTRVMGLSIFLRMDHAGRLTGEQTRNPFDANFSGQVPGEGAGTLLLKRLSDAQRDGDKIHCILHGIGCGYDADSTIAFGQAMQRAWNHTSLSKNDLMLIETSAGADVAAHELEAVKRVYGDAEFAAPVLVDRVDAQFGNMQGASGMASLLKANFELQSLRMPASFALSTPGDLFDKAGPRFTVATTTQTLRQKSTQNGQSPHYLAAVSSWDPCGSAYHAVIERGNRVPLDNIDALPNVEACSPQPATAVSTTSWTLARFTGNSVVELQNSLGQAADDPASCYREAAKSSSGDFPVDGYRLAIVASSADDLAQKLELARQHTGTWQRELLAKSCIFYATPEDLLKKSSGKTAFFCSGQGSQYTSMLKPLVEQFAPAKAAFDEINRDLRKLGYPTFDQLAWVDENELGKDVFITQLSLLCADTILLRSLAALGVVPDVVTGHSFGEFAALVASGAWSFREGAKATFLRCKAIVECQSAVGCMLSTNLDEAASQQVCNRVGSDVFPANINAPNQTVLGGTEQAIAAAEQLIKSQKQLAKIIPVPRPFHTPLMQGVRQPLYEALGNVDTKSPTVPFFSSVTNRYETAPARIRRNLADQMTQPVRYIELVRQLQNEGVTLFVECGPNRVLTLLHRNILVDSANMSILAADSKQGDALCQLLCIQAAYETNRSIDSQTDNNEDWSTWAVQNQETIITLLRQLADQGGVTSGQHIALSNDDIKAATTIANAIGTFEPAIKALLASVGGLAKLIAIVKQSKILQHGTISSVIPSTPKMVLTSHADLQKNVPLQTTKQSLAVPDSPIISEAEYIRLSRDNKGKPPAGLPEGDLYTRFTMRVVRKSLPANSRKTINWQGRALVVGQNEVGNALVEQIRRLGGDPVSLPLSDDRETMLREIERLWDEKPLLHLFVVTAHDTDAVTGVSESDWGRRRDLGIYLPFFVTQQWYKLISKNKLLAKATLCCSSCMGGDFGYGGNIRSVEGGATAGLVKSLDVEAGMATNFAFLSKQIDVSESEPVADRARYILAELAAAVPYETEISYIGGERFITRPIAQQTQANVLPTEQLPTGNWVVTGGGRGITAFLAEHLAECYPAVSLHLLGSRPAPNIDPSWHALKDENEQRAYRQRFHKAAEAAGENAIDKWRQFEYELELETTLTKMRRRGIRVAYYHCDVTDRKRLEQTLQTIREQHGPISGIMHGAGFEVSSRMEAKDPKTVEKTFRIKADAVAALIDLTWGDPIRNFIGFGSVAGRMGSIGQADYSMANETLAKLCDWYQQHRPECRVTCFHWGPWDQIGMAARPEMQSNPLLSTMTLLPPQEGLRHFLNEITTSVRTTEILLIGWSHYKLYYPDETPTAETPVVEPASVAANATKAIDANVATGNDNTNGHTPIRRMVVRMVDGQTSAVCETLSIGGAALILGQNADADALTQRLQSYGIRAAQLPGFENKDELLAAFDRVWTEHGPVSHVFLMTGRDAGAIDIAEKAAWLKRRNTGLFTLYHLMRRWLRKTDEAEMMGQCAIIAATGMNGDFGFASGTAALESAGIAGLLKTIYLEHGGPSRDGVSVRIVDFPTTEPPESVTSSLIFELCTGGFDIEVAYVNGRRRVPRLVEQEAIANGSGVQRGSRWVITGGARGITAEVAFALGKHYGLHLHLIGSRSLQAIDASLLGMNDEQLKPYKREIVKKALAAKESPEKEWNRFRSNLETARNIKRMQDAGIPVNYHSCDVTDAEQVARTFSEIRQQSGEIYGIVHGAGIDGNPVTIKDMLDSQFAIDDKLIGIKVDAVLEMLRHIDVSKLEYFIGFGSISGRFGSPSASSYCAGNDMLCKIMGQLRNEAPYCRAVGIHWHGWDEIGMMMRPSSYGSVKVLKLQLLPPVDGVNHLIRELEAGLPENEIVVSDSHYYTNFYSSEMLIDASKPTLDVAKNPQGRILATNAQTQVMTNQAAGTMPLVQSLVMQPTQETSAVGRCVFRPDRDAFLTDHRFRGRPLLPAVVSLEAFAETAASLFPGKQVAALHDLELVKGLAFQSDTPLEVMIKAEANGNFVNCQLVAPLTNKNGDVLDAEHVFSKAVVELADRVEVPKFNMPQAPAGEWHKIWYQDKSALMYHGPAFQQMSSGLFDETQGAWGNIEAFPIADFAAGRISTGWRMHPSTVDACLYLCGVCVWLETKGALGLPKSMQRLRIGRMPHSSEKCVSHVAVKAKLETEFVFDVQCCGENGEMLFEIENYHCQVVPTSTSAKN